MVSENVANESVGKTDESHPLAPYWNYLKPELWKAPAQIALDTALGLGPDWVKKYYPGAEKLVPLAYGYGRYDLAKADPNNTSLALTAAADWAIIQGAKMFPKSPVAGYEAWITGIVGLAAAQGLRWNTAMQGVEPYPDLAFFNRSLEEMTLAHGPYQPDKKLLQLQIPDIARSGIMQLRYTNSANPEEGMSRYYIARDQRRGPNGERITDYYNAGGQFTASYGEFGGMRSRFLNPHELFLRRLAGDRSVPPNPIFSTPDAAPGVLEELPKLPPQKLPFSGPAAMDYLHPERKKLDPLIGNTILPNQKAPPTFCGMLSGAWNTLKGVPARAWETLNAVPRTAEDLIEASTLSSTLLPGMLPPRQNPSALPALSAAMFHTPSAAPTPAPQGLPTVGAGSPAPGAPLIPFPMLLSPAPGAPLIPFPLPAPPAANQVGAPSPAQTDPRSLLTAAARETAARPLLPAAAVFPIVAGNAPSAFSGPSSNGGASGSSLAGTPSFVAGGAAFGAARPTDSVTHSELKELLRSEFAQLKKTLFIYFNYAPRSPLNTRGGDEMDSRR